MNKVICDICGTAYPETSSQCPICGGAKRIDNRTAFESGEHGRAAGASHTKGGHFSKSNVRKRLRAGETSAPRKSKKNGANEKEPKSNRGLLSLAIVLLLAITIVLIYLIVQYVLPMFMPGTTPAPNKPTPTQPTTITTTPVETTEPTEDLSCTNLVLTYDVVELDAVGREWLLEVRAVPDNTVDTITFATSDPDVARVSAEGRITAVGGGEAVITITCGNVEKECIVKCNVPVETTVVTEPTEAPTEPTDPPVELTLDADDLTFFGPGEIYTFNTGSLSADQISWSTNNEAVAKVRDGTVTAVGPGMTTLYAEYNGKTEECIIRCNFE